MFVNINKYTEKCWKGKMLMGFILKVCQVLDMLCFLKTFAVSQPPSPLILLVQNKQAKEQSIDAISLK